VGVALHESSVDIWLPLQETRNSVQFNLQLKYKSVFNQKSKKTQTPLIKKINKNTSYPYSI
jgi:hypothetical protein